MKAERDEARIANLEETKAHLENDLSMTTRQRDELSSAKKDLEKDVGQKKQKVRELEREKYELRSTLNHTENTLEQTQADLTV